MMCASVVLPRPGGPNSSTWSSASPRLRAAPMKISSCSRALAWPTYSSQRLGRSARSIASSLRRGRRRGHHGRDCGGRQLRSRRSGCPWLRLSPAVGAPFAQRAQRQLDALAHATSGGKAFSAAARLLARCSPAPAAPAGCRPGASLVDARRGQPRSGAELALQLQQQPLGRLLADARHLDQPRRLPARVTACASSATRQARQHRQRRARPDAGDLDQLAEGRALVGWCRSRTAAARPRAPRGASAA